MILRLQRFVSDKQNTLGLLFVNEKFGCFVLEDEKQLVKIPGETRIPAGYYEVQHTFSPKFGKKMLEVMNVPGFTGIRIHTGNDKDDTEGCLLVGDAVTYNDNGLYTIVGGYSTPAYNRIYPQIVKALEEDLEDVWISVQDEQ